MSDHENRDNADLPPEIRELMNNPNVTFHTVKPRTPTDVIHAFCYWFVLNLVGLLVAAIIVSFCWNSLQGVHTLTTIDIHQTFALLIALRVLAFVVRF